MSAASQAAAHQQSPPVSALNTTAPALFSASPSNRSNPDSVHSSPARDGYGQYANQYNAVNSSAPSSRRPSRRPSASDSHNGFDPSMSSRTAIASPVPVPVGPTSPDQHSSTTSERRRNMPTAVPPRTSSSHHSTNGGSSSRRATQTGERDSRRTHAESGRDTNGNIDPMDENVQNSRSRRGTHGPQDPPQRSSSTRDGRSHGSANPRSPPATTTSSKGPSREASEILNSILISQPEVDIEREKERLAQAQPHQIGAMHDDDAAAPPPVVATAEHGEESRRSQRSRHDHLKHGKPTKFGEYILGNTIGEGEFGKVKLGWKQEGGVQVGKAVTSARSNANQYPSTGCNQAYQEGCPRKQSIPHGQNHARSSDLAAIDTPQYCTATQDGRIRTALWYRSRVCLWRRAIRLHP